MSRLTRLPLLALVLATPAFGGPAADVILRIVTPEQTVTLTAAEFSALPRTEVKVVEPHEKKERLCSGVTMRELLGRAQAPLGEKFRGPALTQGVQVRGKDNYTVLSALAEFDENFSARTLLLSDGEDRAPPPATAAPLRLAAPGDKRGARWARMVTSIEIVSIAPAR